MSTHAGALLSLLRVDPATVGAVHMLLVQRLHAGEADLGYASGQQHPTVHQQLQLCIVPCPACWGCACCPQYRMCTEASAAATREPK
jgi:hypothetical protein